MAEARNDNFDNCETLDEHGYVVSEDFIISDTCKVLKRRVGMKIKFQGKPPNDGSQDHFLFKSEMSQLRNMVAFVLSYPIGVASEPGKFPLSKYVEYIENCMEIEDEERLKFNEFARTLKSPAFYLNVAVIEARGLEAKDIDGFSDPYCIMGIVPGSRQLCLEIGKCDALTVNDGNGTPQTLISDQNASGDGAKGTASSRFGQSFRRRATVTNELPGTSIKPADLIAPVCAPCLKDSKIPVKLMRTTSVKKNTLCPIWNEKFQFELDDISSDLFHLDIWDHDEETSVLDAVRSLNEVKGVKQLGRYFKQVSQSARKGQSGDLDDFLGCINIAVRDIPSAGIENWFKLVGRSARSKVQGSIRLMLKLTTVSEEDELRGPKMSDIRMHINLIYTFLNYELKQSKKPSTEWSGRLAPEAEFILFQHAEHFGLGKVHTAMCRWICLAKKYRKRPIPCRLLDEQLKTLFALWTDKSLSRDQLELLGNSFKGFTEHAITLISQCQVVFSSDHPESLQHLECLLRNEH